MELRSERHLNSSPSGRGQTEIAAIPGEKPTPERLLGLMAQDKKVKGGKLALVLARGIGEAFLERDVPMDRLRDFLKKECAA